MDQSVMVFAGTAARSSAIPTPSAGMVAYSTATQLQVYNGSAWVDLSTGYGVATGGASTAITVGGTAYTLLTFTSTGTLTVTKAGLFDCMVWSAGGGGAGGIGTITYGGGGGAGAGGYLQQTLYLSANTTITVGAGGAGGGNEQYGSRGNNSSVGTPFIMIGGGAGQGYSNTVNNNQNFGASTSGGACITQITSLGILAFGSTYGFAGGTGSNGLSQGAGGGGGTGAIGANASGTNGGAGGAGFDVSAFIGSGSALFKGGGGGGAGTGTGGAGGSSIGGTGASGANSAGGAAGANTCSGGGSATGISTGGAGGSGIVYVRFKV
jgi:hypothetical protein